MKMIKIGIITFGLSLGIALATDQTSYTIPSALGFEFQRLNNCGPVTAKMALSLLGVNVTQAEAAAALKGSYPDRNVTTPELAAYLQANGFNTVRRWLITPDLVRRLVQANFPMILHQQQKLDDDIGHFRIAYGYTANSLLFGDSMFGGQFRLTDSAFNTLTKPYSGEYLIAYRPEQAKQLEDILGSDWSKFSNIKRLATLAKSRLNKAPDDAYAWWGLGQSLLFQGMIQPAANAFNQADQLGLSKKHYWYQHDAFEAWNKAGLYQKTIRVAATALKAYANSRELNTYYGNALERVGQFRKALAAFKAAYTEDTRSVYLKNAIARLSQRINAQ